MDFLPVISTESDTPLYRQVYDQIASRIRDGRMSRGERLPATRELAGLLGLNRTTVSAAYEMLEAEGLIAGQVGRGSFVTGTAHQPAPGVDWTSILNQDESRVANPPAVPKAAISFVMSRPSSELFPLDEFRATCSAVLARHDLGDILQLGSPSGFEPLRRRLLDDARRQNLAGPGDDLLITNGCQQAMDLIARVVIRPGDTVALEDPAYTGLKNLLTGMGARLAGVPLSSAGLDLAQLSRVLEREKPRLLVITPNFQNPTGISLTAAQRRAVHEAANAAGVPIVENDAYGDLRYFGEPLPAIKQLDPGSGTVLLRSFSKISFPGLRVGWVLGPKPFLDRLRHAKEAADLHTDQLAQAVLLEFVESGRFDAHRARVLKAGGERLQATLEACRDFLPPGSRWTHPEGGMNVWVRLPEPLDAAELLPRALREGVAYVPGRHFAVSRPDAGTLRLSFAGLAPDQIRNGIAVLGKIFAGELERAAGSFDPAPAMV